MDDEKDDEEKKRRTMTEMSERRAYIQSVKKWQHVICHIKEDQMMTD